MEASGTGNMKFALNGALTIGTLDGANIEILEHVGADNIFIFGMKADEVLAQRAKGLDASACIKACDPLRQAIESIETGAFSPEDRNLYQPIAHALRHLDHYMVSNDFESYFGMQRSIDRLWGSREWKLASILNTARMAWFSADRTIREYAEDVWKVRTLDS